MHVKRIHSMLESLTECAESALKNDQTHVGKYPISEVIDMIKDLSEAEYHSKITNAMDEEKEEEEKQDEYALMRMKEEYGEEEGKRYYNEWRYSNGRYAPKGRGMRMGYTVPIRYLTSSESDRMSPDEYMRDMDRWDGRMYYADRMMPSEYMMHNGNRGYSEGQSGARNTGNMSGSQSNGNSGNRGYSEGFSDGQSRGYEEGNRRGYEDGNREGYERGYSEGERRGRSEGEQNGRSSQSRSERARRGYEESQAMNSNTTQDGKEKRMRELNSYMDELTDDMKSLVANMGTEEKTMLKQKMAKLNSLV